MQLTLTRKMTTAQVVKMSVTVNNNSPIQDYVHPHDQTQPSYEGSSNTHIVLSSFWTTETSVGCIKVQKEPEKDWRDTNLRMKYYMINSIVETILLTAFLIKFA